MGGMDGPAGQSTQPAMNPRGCVSGEIGVVLARAGPNLTEGDAHPGLSGRCSVTQLR